MINLMLNVRRRFWTDVSTETVQVYLKDLTKLKDELNTMHFTYLHNLFGSEGLLKEIRELVDKELNFAPFTLSIRKDASLNQISINGFSRRRRTSNRGAGRKFKVSSGSRQTGNSRQLSNSIGVAKE